MRFALPLVLAAAAAAADLDPQRLARIAPRMQALVDQGKVAGIVTLVARNGKILHHEAVGVLDAETRKPIAKDSIFQIMSMTKPMTATAIMILADEGKLAVSDPVEKHLPEFRGQMMVASRAADGATTLKKPSRPITIRDLLTHTSGLPSQPPAGLFELPQRMDVPLEKAVLVYSQLPLEFEPGTKWLYSNNGIATLGRIVEVASGQPFESFLRDRIWTPLGMKDTFLFPPDDKKARISSNHVTRDGKLAFADPKTTLGGEARNHRKGAVYPAPEWGAFSTAADLFAFYEMTRQGGVFNGKRILSKAAVEVMTALHTGDVPVSPGNGFALGWQYTKDNAGTLDYVPVGTFGHGGAFGTQGWIDKQRGIVGVFMVQGGAGSGEARSAFMKMAAGAVID